MKKIYGVIGVILAMMVIIPVICIVLLSKGLQFFLIQGMDLIDSWMEDRNGKEEYYSQF